MTPTPDVRRVATVAATTSAAVAGAAGVAFGVLATQAVRAKREIGPRTTAPPYADGRYGRRTGTSIRLAVLGDSGAASLGADHPEETLAAILASGVAEASGRGVVVATMAVVGAQSKDLGPQVERALVIRPHVVFILIGGNDVTHLRGTRRPARELGAAVRALREAGCEVVVGTCPDLGTVKPLGPPLRDVARRMSRELAAAQTVAVVENGGRAVSLGNLLGPEFAARPEVMFSRDQFHPSAAGYESVALAVLPTVLAALGLGPGDDLDGVTSSNLPVLVAAEQAAGAAGTETSGAESGVRARLGSLAQLRHRLRRPLPAVRTPADDGDDGDHDAEVGGDGPATDAIS